MTAVPARCSPAFLVVAIAAIACPAEAVELYFNSHGWSKIYRYDTMTAQTTLIAAHDILDTTFCSSAVFGPDGALYGAGADEVVRISLNGGQAHWAEYMTLDHLAGDGLAFDGQGNLYTASGSIVRRVSSAGQTSAAIAVTYQGQSLYISGIGFSSDGALWAADSNRIFRVNPATGVATLQAASTPAGGIFTSLNVGSDGMVRALGYFDHVYEYNPQTGAQGWAYGPLRFEGRTFSPSSIAALANSPVLDDADFNDDGHVDGADFLDWQRGVGDANHDGLANAVDLGLWRQQFGAASVTPVPEPAALAMVLVAAVLLAAHRRSTQRWLSGVSRHALAAENWRCG